MNEQSETERNEAIRVLEELSKSNEWQQENKTDPGMNIWALAFAISALRTQSEAERRIESVREYCENAIGEELYSLPHTEKEIMYIEMKQAVANYILEILEDKQSEE